MKHKHSLLITLVISVLLSVSVSAQEDNIRITKNNLKVTILSLGSGSSRVTYERAFTPKNSAELTVGVIGWGWDFLHKTKSNGILLKGAFKWNLIPQKNANSWLAGFYVKPEIVWAHFKYQPKDLQSMVGSLSFDKTSQVAVLAECGYQVVAKWFVFDVYAGFGPSVGTGNGNNYFHSFVHFPKDWPFAFTSGFRVGVAF